MSDSLSLFPVCLFIHVSACVRPNPPRFLQAFRLFLSSAPFWDLAQFASSLNIPSYAEAKIIRHKGHNIRAKNTPQAADSCLANGDGYEAGCLFKVIAMVSCEISCKSI